ncbi:protein DBF4 homolog B isoform X1 [Pteropus alecto]|uniref:protein DBF4 homolog B isoform X1 n=1 Tax=Pteropus alecto TaxID=9402 RepID=UPI0007688283|nr:protein DBF4 homolog B isoform X1 [Pteropus alecto]
MAESRLRASDLGAQLRVSSCLGKCQKSSPDAGRRQPFSGKSFYLDLPAGKTLQFLMEAIQQLGGVIEGFLSKEVNYIVSSRREAKAESSGTSYRGRSSPSEIRVEIPSTANPKGSHTGPSQKPVDSVSYPASLLSSSCQLPMSRGKELLRKAIRNQGSSSGGGSGSSSSLLTSARSWGVRILHVDAGAEVTRSQKVAGKAGVIQCARPEMMMHVQQLSLDALCAKKQGPKKPEGTCPAESRTRKVARLKAPFLKIEDESRKFRPFHHQFKSFPEISFLGPKDGSPFEAPTTLDRSHCTREPKDREPSPQSAARTVPRRKKGYCECCQEAYEELHGHLQSAQHQAFALEAHPYAAVDRIIAQLSHSFADIPSQASLPRQPGSPALDCDPLCPKTLPPGQPSHAKAASPKMREEDNRQAPDIPEQDEMAGSMKAPAEHVGADKIPGPAASCQELGGSVGVIVDPPGTPMSRNPDFQCLLTSSGFTDFSSGPDLALVGHKRKVQSPCGNAEKRPGVSGPQASFFVSSFPNPCGTRTTNGRHLSLPLPGPEPSPLASLLPSCHPQTTLALPDPSPWQPTDRPAELWATQPPWPGGRYSPGSEDSECAAPGPVSQQVDQLPSCPKAPGQLSAHLHSAVSTQPPGGPAGSHTTSLPHPLPASGGASCSRWLWGPQPLPVPCLPVSQPQPSASRELLL